MNLIEKAKRISGEVISHRRCIHQNAEIGLHLPKTKAYVMKWLKEYGYEPEEIGDSGVTATVGRHGGKVFLLRADMDALPIEEQTDLPFACRDGCMHACGHDCHTAMLLGAAKLLKEMEAELEGMVKLLFQPAEETLLGAREMVEAGVLKNPDVDAAMMIHVAAGMDTPSGMPLVMASGVTYSSADWFRIEVQGKGGHGAMPESCINPIGILASIYQEMQGIVAEGIPGDAHATMTVGQIHGGETSNIIPDTAYMTGTIRTYDEQVRTQITEQLERTATGIAQARGGRCEVKFEASVPSVVCDKEVREEVLQILRDMIGGKESVLDLETFQGGSMARVSGSEDFAWIAREVPSAVIMLPCGTAEEGYPHSLHHPKADFREDVLYIGSAVYAQAAVDWLKKRRKNDDRDGQ